MVQVTHHGGELRIASAHRGIVWPLLFGKLSSDAFVLISGAANPDNRLCCWDTSTGDLLWATEDGELEHGCFSVSMINLRDGRVALAAATDSGLQLWDASSGSLRQGPGWLTSRTVWGIDSYAADDGTIQLVGAGNDHLVHRWDAASGATSGDPLAGHRDSVKCVAAEAIPGHDVLIASGSDDGTVRRWDAATGECLSVSEVGNAEVLDVNLLVSRTGASILTCGDSEGAIHRWDAVTARPLGAPIETSEMIGSLVTIEVAGEPTIIASSESGMVRQWHALTGRPIDQSHAGMSVAAMVDTDGRVLLATGTEDGDIILRAV